MSGISTALQNFTKGSDTPESFLSKVTFKSNLRKKLSRIEHVLIMKVSLEGTKVANVFMTHVQVFFRKTLSKATFERKLSSVSLTLHRTTHFVSTHARIRALKCLLGYFFGHSQGASMLSSSLYCSESSGTLQPI